MSAASQGGDAVHVAELGIQVPEILASDFLSKLYYLSDSITGFGFEGAQRSRVQFRLREGSNVSAGALADRMATVAKKMCAAFKDYQPKVLVDRSGREVPYQEDPHPVLAELGQLHFSGQGRYALGPRVQGLMSFFERKFLELAEQFSAPAYQFPTLIGAETLEKCKYLRSFPQSLNLVAHLREDIDAISKFASGAKWDGEKLNYDFSSLGHTKCLLSPSVCFHWYAWLVGQSVKDCAITAVGKCFRYESGNLTGLERLWDFTMREIIFVGAKEYVLEQRQRSMDATVALLDEWGLAYEIKTATDPFFIDEYSAMSNFQRSFELKFEIRALLPYKKNTLAVGSFNHHQDFFGRVFSISGEQGGAPVHTGCTAFGVERLALAFLAQYGPQLQRWPEEVRNEVAG